MTISPTLAEVDRLRLELGIAQCEMVRLRLQLLQGQLEQQTTALNAGLKAATREGYELQRQSAEQWMYVPIPAPTTKGDAS